MTSLYLFSLTPIKGKEFKNASAKPLLGEQAQRLPARCWGLHSCFPPTAPTSQEQLGKIWGMLSHSKRVSCSWGRVRMVLWVQPLHQRGHPLPPGSLGHMSSARHHSLGALRGRSIWRTGTSYKKQIKPSLCLSYLNYQWDSGTAQTNIQ